MSSPIAAYFATVGIAVDNKALADVDKYLTQIQNKLKKASTNNPLRVNLRIDEKAFHKHLQGIVGRASKSALTKVKLEVDPVALRRSISQATSGGQYRVPLTAMLSRASIQNIRSQLQGALYGIPVHAVVKGVKGQTTSKVASTATGTALGQRPYGAEAARRRASLTGRGDPSAAEFLMGRPERSSLSAGNRRYIDAIMSKGTEGFGGDGVFGSLLRTTTQGVGRFASTTAIGRAGILGGMSLGGVKGGVVGGLLTALPAAGIVAAKGITTAFTTLVTAPFKLLSGAVNMVTSSLYRMAQTLLPFIVAGSYIDRRVNTIKSQDIALQTTSSRFGSNAPVERKWLMNMANREGMSYEGMIDQFTSFIGATAPSMGIERSRKMFEAFTQYGSTHGATKESAGRAFYALSQIKYTTGLLPW